MAGDRCGPRPHQNRSTKYVTSLKRINLALERDRENIAPNPGPDCTRMSSATEPPIDNSCLESSTKPNSTGPTVTGTDASELPDAEFERRLRSLLKSFESSRTRKKKHSYTREEKLQYIQLYKTTFVSDSKHPETLPSLMSKRFAAKKFGVTHSMLSSWLKKEDKIRNAKGGTRWMSNRSPSWPELESKLFAEFMEARGHGRSISKAWFIRTARRIFSKLYPELVQVSEDGTKIYSSKFSKGWFLGFKRRWRVSWRAKTKIATKPPEQAEPFLEQWMQFNRRNTQIRHGESPAELGRYFLCDFYNMDQTPLPYEFLEGRTYDVKGNKTVWVRTIRGGWHKRQATLMVTVCADGKNRLDPLIIFRGQRKRKDVIEEAKRYHSRVRVEFNSKAYSNEEVTLRWIYNDLRWATDHDLNSNQPRFIALDVFSGQKTPRVLKAFKRLNFVTSFIPEGCTSYVQPLDTHLNKAFKNKISELMDAEFEQDPDKWEDSKNFCVGDRRVLVTHCVGEAWEWLHREKKDMIIKSFRDCGLTLNVDGSEDDEIHVKDLPNLKVGDWKIGGLNCNLNRDGKTSDGKSSTTLIDVEADETAMFSYNPYDEEEQDSEEEEEEGEYVLENDFHSMDTIRQWSSRVRENHDKKTHAASNCEAATHTVMNIGYLCN